MARVYPSVVSNGLSGKAGTVVFVEGETGVYIRPRTVPANPQTPAQTAVRSQFAHAVAA